MATTLRDITEAIDKLWPIAGQADWDSSGLVSGALTQPVSRVLLAVDVTHDTVTEALALNVDLLLAHHPLLLRGVTTIAEDRYKGELLSRLVRGGCALAAAHTNADRVESGTSATLATALGVTISGPIVPHPLGGGTGVVGTVSEQRLGDFARRIADVIPHSASGVRVSGDFAKTIRTIALCAGAGDSLLAHPAVRSVDVYVTSDLRHHPTSEFREQARLDDDTALIDISHWAAEWMWLNQAATEVRNVLPELDVTVSDLSTDPWTFQVVQ